MQLLVILRARLVVQVRTQALGKEAVRLVLPDIFLLLVLQCVRPVPQVHMLLAQTQAVVCPVPLEPTCQTLVQLHVYRARWELFL